MTSSASLSGAKYFLERYQLYPKKRLGQNFLIDKNILNKIADSCNLDKHDLVVEIGPGMGALTEQLASRCGSVLSIDIDTSMEPILREVLAEYKNVRLLFDDILKVNLEQELQTSLRPEAISGYKVCANIPYNITTPIIFYLLETCPHMESATLMMQKEVALRILAKPNSKDYGLLTLMTEYYSNVEHIMNVSHNCFYPRPEVDSTVIMITPLKQKRVKVQNELKFKKLLRAAFQKRRKTILNICYNFYGNSKEQITPIFQELNISPQQRPENLTIEEFAMIANAFSLQEE